MLKASKIRFFYKLRGYQALDNAFTVIQPTGWTLDTLDPLYALPGLKKKKETL